MTIADPAGISPTYPRAPAVPKVKEIFRFLGENNFALAMFLSLLLIGADRFAIRPGGMTIRLVFPVLITAFGLLYMQRERVFSLAPGLTLLFLLLAIAGALSVINSFDVAKSLGYTIWVLFDFFVIITLCYNFAKHYPAYTVLAIWLLIFRIHVFLLLGEIALGLAHGAVDRPHVWFYEPSYLAIFLSGYFGASLYLFLNSGRRYALDLTVAIVGVIATTSATGIFGMIFAVLLNFLIARQRAKLLFATLLIAMVFIAILALFFRGTVYFYLVLGFLLQPDFSFDLIFDRAGDRMLRMLVGWSAFLHHPWTGVGIGGDVAYMAIKPYPENAASFVHPWDNTEAGQPFSNIVVEVLGTMGIVGVIPFAAILIYAAKSAISAIRRKDLLTPAATAFFLGFFSVFLALQFESTFLRYYLWSPLGLGFGVIAQMNERKKAGGNPAT